MSSAGPLPKTDKDQILTGVCEDLAGEPFRPELPPAGPPALVDPPADPADLLALGLAGGAVLLAFALVTAVVVTAAWRW